MSRPPAASGGANPGREMFRRVDELFDAALDVAAHERAAFVERAAAADPELAAAVLRLLHAHDRAGDFLDTPAAVIAAPLLDGEHVARVGAFRVVREIGRGGMGAVYLGERDDGQFEQRVALKLVRGGAGDAPLMRRFLAERRILATLEHPHIARLVDGGVTDGGLPYFAMEYVEGRPITAFADERRLPVDARLRLFLDVCSAVQYAHRHMVVHRDLKPGNILVTGDGVVKLLDFGIARMLDGHPEDALTGHGVRLLTPEYASPEQLRGEPATPASDVYALGVLLHELLTGRHPYRVRGMTAQEVEQRALTAVPVAPSAVVLQDEGEEPAGVVAARRGCTTASLARRLSGDLDVITASALGKEASRRYATVTALADDVRRSLTGEPISARPRTPTPGLRRPRLRGRAAVVAAALMLLLTIVTVATRADVFRPSAHEAPERVAARALFEEGMRAFHDEGDARRAFSLFTAALGADSAFAMAALHAARAANAFGADSVVRYLSLAEALAASLPDRERLLISAHAANVFNDPRALAVADSLAVRYPDDAAGALQHGIALMADGRFTDAVVALNRAVRLEPLAAGPVRAVCHACDAYSVMVSSYVLMDSLDAALALTREWAALQPQHSSPWELGADILDVLGRAEEAATARRRLAELRPGDALREVSDARRFLRIDDFYSADRVLAASMTSADPAVARIAYWWRALSLRQQGAFVEAARAVRRSTDLLVGAGENPTASMLLEAAILLDAGEPARAAEVLDSTRRLLPDHRRVSRNARDLAWLLTLEANARAAAGDTSRLAVLADSVERVGALSAYGRDRRLHHYVRALLHRARGELPEAEAALHRSIFSVTGGYTRANLELARLMIARGAGHEAIPLLQAALRAPLAGPAVHVSRTELYEAIAQAYASAAETDSAALYLERVARAWRQADPVVQPRRARAQHHLQRMREPPAPALASTHSVHP